ncbi:MAG: DsbA family protein [Pseudoprimorskyibacter sp.]|nr:DsbA family protein [Pseudoprimorskyibacter sp.]
MKRILAITVLTLVLVAGGGSLLMQRSAPDLAGGDIVLPGAANAQEATTEQQAAAAVQEMVLGNPDATVEVVEYASYTCPHCASFHAGAYKDLKANYIDTGKIRFVYREVYFDRYGLWASLVARCEPAKFFGITDLVYSEQQSWARAGSDAAVADALRRIGRRAGMADDKLEACLTDRATAQGLVAWFQSNVERDGISSTPSFLIDGQLHSNMTYSEMSGLIDDALN